MEGKRIAVWLGVCDVEDLKTIKRLFVLMGGLGWKYKVSGVMGEVFLMWFDQRGGCVGVMCPRIDEFRS